MFTSYSIYGSGQGPGCRCFWAVARSSIKISIYRAASQLVVEFSSFPVIVLLLCFVCDRKTFTEQDAYWIPRPISLSLHIWSGISSNWQRVLTRDSADRNLFFFTFKFLFLSMWKHCETCELSWSSRALQTSVINNNFTIKGFCLLY